MDRKLKSGTDRRTRRIRSRMLLACTLVSATFPGLLIAQQAVGIAEAFKTEATNTQVQRRSLSSSHDEVAGNQPIRASLKSYSSRSPEVFKPNTKARSLSVNAPSPVEEQSAFAEAPVVINNDQIEEPSIEISSVVATEVESLHAESIEAGLTEVDSIVEEVLDEQPAIETTAVTYQLSDRVRNESSVPTLMIPEPPEPIEVVAPKNQSVDYLASPIYARQVAVSQAVLLDTPGILNPVDLLQTQTSANATRNNVPVLQAPSTSQYEYASAVPTTEQATPIQTNLIIKSKKMITKTFDKPIVIAESSDESCCKVFLVDARNIAVLGVSDGTALIQMQFADSNVQTFSVHVQSSLSSAEPVDDQQKIVRVVQSIQDMYAGSKVELIQSKTGSILVRGSVRMESDAEEIMIMVRQMFLVPVQDKLIVKSR
jgi:hypothetical protein